MRQQDDTLVRLCSSARTTWASDNVRPRQMEVQWLARYTGRRSFLYFLLYLLALWPVSHN